jgi:hypothetical protein
MDREELQGVIGHEMTHIRSYDMRLTMLVTATMLSGIGSFSQMLFGTLTRGMAALLSREREYLADAAAVEFTRNPNGLIRASSESGGDRGAVETCFACRCSALLRRSLRHRGRKLCGIHRRAYVNPLAGRQIRRAARRGGRG